VPFAGFVKQYANAPEQNALVTQTFADEVAKGEYPDYEHSYDWPIR
jgi:ketopantoate hydroxymethyltransferase